MQNPKNITRCANSIALFLVLAACLVCGSACQATYTTYHGAVWSDDGTEQAFVKNVVTYYPEGYNAQAYQVHVQSPDGTRQRPVGVSIKHARFWKGDRVYYMRQEGYVVVSWLEDYRFNNSTLYAAVDIDTNTYRVLHTTTPTEPRADVIPSPSGTLIALITQNPTSSGIQVKVQFLRGAFTDPNGDLDVVETYTFTAPERMLVRWTKTDMLNFWQPGYGEIAWEVGVGTPPHRTAPRPVPACGDQAPPTTSSLYSSDGVQIQVADPETNVLREVGADAQCAWDK